MFTYEINVVCDGEGVLKQAVKGCASRLSLSSFLDAGDAVLGVWTIARRRGWHMTEAHGTKHLCPVCWSKFLEK